MNGSHESASTRPCYRSGAAARLARMPVATLRVWERRYGVAASARSASGHRLYSDADVQRLRLLRQLVDRGHAIGVIATLSHEQLQSMLRVDGEFMAAAPPGEAGPWHVVMVGDMHGGPPPAADAACLRSLVRHGSLRDAMAALEPGEPVDALVLHSTALQPESARDLLTLAEHCSARHVIVFYALGDGMAVDLLQLAGVHLHRATIAAVAWNRVWHDLRSRTGAEPVHTPHWDRVPRRHDDAQLMDLAQRASTIACEYPRHLGEIIRQLSALEAYSDGCASRSAEDALLHRYLGHVANRARAQFETAMERLATREGWLPDEPR